MTAVVCAGCAASFEPVFDGGTLCTGVCTSDGGPDASSPSDAGAGGLTGIPTSISALRQLRPIGLHVQLPDVEVSQVVDSLDCDQGAHRRRFWVIDRQSPAEGLWIDTGCNPAPAVVSVGEDVLLDGWFGLEPPEPVDGFRARLGPSLDGGTLSIRALDAGAAVVDTFVDAGSPIFQSGGPTELLSTRVRVRGPLQLVNPNPPELSLTTYDGGLRWTGFAVSGGVLVFSEAVVSADAGCDWRRIALDGGQVLFPLGVAGVLDTYWQPPCPRDGGCGATPGIDAGLLRVLYPADCANDLNGVVDAG